jgi:AraC-like DNA-binding protein
MQNVSYPVVFDTTDFTIERPVVPYKQLFDYYPSEKVEELHYHNFFEIGFSEYGSGMFIVDGEAVPFNGQCSFIIYAGQSHIAQSTSAEKSRMHFLYLDLDKLFYGDDRLLLKSIRSMRVHHYSIQTIIPASQDSEIYDVIKIILYEAARAEEGYLEVLKGLVYSLLQKHNRYMTVRSNPQNDDNYIALMQELRPTLNYINMNYTKKITIDNLVEINNFSKPTLERKIMAYTGYSPMQYIHHLRLNRAASILTNGHLKTVEIAYDVGYPSISCFNRQFKKKFGCSPKQWKLKNR